MRREKIDSDACMINEYQTLMSLAGNGNSINFIYILRFNGEQITREKTAASKDVVFLFLKPAVVD